MDIEDDHFGIIEEDISEDQNQSQLSGVKRRTRPLDERYPEQIEKLEEDVAILAQSALLSIKDPYANARKSKTNSIISKLTD